MVRNGNSGQAYVFTIEDRPVSKEEFLYNLDKNNYERDSLISRAEIDEYLDLYINFKLKVYEARQLGIDTTRAFIDEFNTYKDQLTESYFKDDSVIDAMVRTAYERMKTEVSASHILIRINNSSDPADTLKAFNKAQEVYQKTLEENNFNRLALAFSEDPSVINNKGYLGYFTALQMIYPFEEAAFNTPVGGVSAPVKTRFGYHILKVHDRRPSRGKVQVAHIMLHNNPNASKKDSLLTVNKINAIHDSVTSKNNWEYYCRKYSMDQSTRSSGGVLAPFGTGRIVASFSEAAFALENPGDISEPVLTPSGWHIIRLIQKIPLESFEELQNEITGKVKQDARASRSQDLLIRRLKKENKFVMNKIISEQVDHYADSSLIQGFWSYDSTDTFLDFILFTINDTPFPVWDFFDFVKKNQRPNPKASPVFYLDQLLEEFTGQAIIQYEKDHLAEKNIEYRMLVNEYREGILLFELMDRKVWTRAMEDTTGLEAFYKNNINKYLWKERLKATIFKTDDLENIRRIRELLEKPFYFLDTLTITLDPVDLYSPGNIFKNPVVDSLYNLAAGKDDFRLAFSLPTPEDSARIISWLLENKHDTAQFILSASVKSAGSIRLVSTAKKDLNRLINDNSIVNLQIESGLYEIGDHEIIDRVDRETGIQELSIETDEYIVFIEEVVPPVVKKLEETKGAVISDYQNFLEKEWLIELKEKYNVDINNDVLKEIYYEFEES